MSTNRNLAAALMYASYGWAVFPLRPGQKIPASLHGFHDATTDKSQIERWWQEIPNAGIGIATGCVSNLIVLDVDPRNNGHHSLAAIRAQFEELPVTPEAITGGGGRHYFFLHPGNGTVLPSAKPWPGIDVKAEGGYVAACPSLHPSGLIYRWAPAKEPDTVPLAPAPEWLITLLQERRTILLSEVEPQRGSKTLTKGARNSGLTSLAGTMQRRGMGYEAILAALLAENNEKCKPALPEREVAAIAVSVGRYAPDEESVPRDEAPAQAGTPYMDVTGAVEEEAPEPDWLLDGWLAKGDCALLVGDPGAGKSWLVTDLGLAGASGLPIWDHFAHDPFRVLIVDEENPPDEVRRRLHLVAQARHLKSADLEDRLRLTVPRHGFNFKDSAAKAGLSLRIQEFVPDLIIFDSITAISGVIDESKAVEIRRFFHEELYSLQQICGSTILCVHHTNKGVYQKDRQFRKAGYVRGSIDFVAAADTTFLLDSQEKEGVTTLTNIKPRRMTQPNSLQIKILDTVSGVAPTVVEATYEGDKHTARELILLSLEGTDTWVENLFERVQGIANGEPIGRSAFDRALHWLWKEEIIDRKPSTVPHKKLYRLQALKLPQKTTA